MNQRTVALGALVAAALSVSWANAQSLDDAQDRGRYILERAGDAFVRLDRQTGELSYCRVQPAGLACVASAEERDAWESEVARLESRIARIESDLSALKGSRAETGEAQPGPPEPGPQADRNRDEEAELNRALDFAERAWRRFFDAVRKMKDETARENPAR
jgi:hypothetical protein